MSVMSCVCVRVVVVRCARRTTYNWCENCWAKHELVVRVVIKRPLPLPESIFHQRTCNTSMSDASHLHASTHTHTHMSNTPTPTHATERKKRTKRQQQLRHKNAPGTHTQYRRIRILCDNWWLLYRAWWQTTVARSQQTCAVYGVHETMGEKETGPGPGRDGWMCAVWVCVSISKKQPYEQCATHNSMLCLLLKTNEDLIWIRAHLARSIVLCVLRVQCTV